MWKVVSHSLSFCPSVEISWPAERTDRRQREATYLMKTVILWCPNNPNPPTPSHFQFCLSCRHMRSWITATSSLCGWITQWNCPPHREYFQSSTGRKSAVWNTRRDEQTLEFNDLMFNSLPTHNELSKNMIALVNYDTTVSMMEP